MRRGEPRASTSELKSPGRNSIAGFTLRALSVLSPAPAERFHIGGLAGLPRLDRPHVTRQRMEPLDHEPITAPGRAEPIRSARSALHQSLPHVHLALGIRL
jgi:hypothetical protein